MVQAQPNPQLEYLRRWTVDEYHRMIAVGILTPSDRDRHPIPEDIYLLIEVADSTLSHDRLQSPSDLMNLSGKGAISG